MSVSHADLIRAALEWYGADPANEGRPAEEALAAVAVWEEETSRLREQLEALEAGGDRLSAVAVAEASQPDLSPGVVARVFAAARKHQGHTLRAVEAGSGVPNAHVSQIERGLIEKPTLDTFCRLAAFYGLDLVESAEICGYGAEPLIVALAKLRAERDEARAETARLAAALHEIAESYPWLTYEDAECVPYCGRDTNMRTNRRIAREALAGLDVAPLNEPALPPKGDT